MDHMGRAGLCVGLAIAALFVGGCGSDVSTDSSDSPGAVGATTQSSSGSGGSTRSSTSTQPRIGSGGSDAAPPSYGPTFPLTLRRTGGIAGFDDRIVLDLDGRLHVETRSVHGRVCTLAPAQQRRLVSLLATLRLDPSTTDLPTSDLPGDQGPVGPDTPDAPDAVTDPITITVTDDEARPIDLSGPSLGEVSGLVGVLVGDVTLSVPATTRCTTPTTSSASSASSPAR
ncbi:hypothetical protein GCM10009721_38570 [Terrabacter tumescens]|uniref:Uncharacterized protein n=2 Tax=Terrabacter tumescens TaxID=60443 RepID=A0ABQ2IF70_9MICO|nr:hypothetical protein GCM10009721_38570 [Terrabacter tumescens]